MWWCHRAAPRQHRPDLRARDRRRPGPRLPRLAIDAQLSTGHHALPPLPRRPGGLVVEVTDGTAAYNADHYRVSLFDDVAKTSVIRIAWPQAQELRPHQATAVALTPGWMRSELMLEHHGASESNAAGDERTPALLPLRDQQMRRPGRRRARRRSRRVALERTVAVERPARAGLRLR
jgi:NAD(P)-dependent dehydrogenase (short-subunit alcohol dehydrogenase family)